MSHIVNNVKTNLLINFRLITTSLVSFCLKNNHVITHLVTSQAMWGLVKGLVNTCIVFSISSIYYVLIARVKISRYKEGAGDRRKGIRTLNLWCCKWLLSCVVLRWIWGKKNAFTNATYCFVGSLISRLENCVPCISSNVDHSV